MVCGAHGGKTPSSKQAILNWLQGADDLDVEWIFVRLMSDRPELLLQLANELHLSDQTPFHPKHVDEGLEAERDIRDSLAFEIDQKQLAKEINAVEAALHNEQHEHHVASDTGTQGALTVVQFCSSVHYAEEGDGMLEVPLMRFGDTGKRSVVPYCTKDYSAKAGRSYIAAHSTVLFDPGERWKTIKIDIIDNDFWDTTLSFKIELLQEGLEGAALGEYVWTTTVRIIDNDLFPTNSISDAVKTNLESVNKWYLLKEYLGLCLQNPVVRLGTIKKVGLDLLHNLNYLVGLFLNVYLVDFILNPKSDASSLLFVKHKTLSLWIVVLGNVLPFLLLHYLDYLSTSFHIGGRTRTMLQASLLRKFFAYSSRARASAERDSLVMAITRDAPTVSADGYQSFLVIIKELGRILMVVIFKVLGPVVFHTKFNYEALYIIVLFPLMLGVFLYLRMDRTTQCLREESDRQDAVVQHVETSVMDFDFVVGYGMEDRFTTQFEDLLGDLNLSIRHANQVRMNNIYFSRWLGSIMQAFYVVFGGVLVLRGVLSLGMFLATIGVFHGIAAGWGEIYSSFLNMESAIPALTRITKLLNAETDDGVHCKNLNLRIAKAKALLQESDDGKVSCDELVHPDDLPIYVVEMCFEYTWGLVKTLEVRGILRFQQGSLVTLMGPVNQGKATLLKLVSGSLVVPESEDVRVFVPPHLRRVHVPDLMVLFDGTLRDNLTFGAVSPENVDRKLVERICSRIGVAQNVVDLLNTDTKMCWKQVISQTQSRLLSLARALVSNPEVLVVHSALEGLPEDIQLKVLALLKEFTVHKGVDDHTDIELRRPRTCITSCNQVNFARLCDQVFHVCTKTGIREVPPSEVTHALLCT